MDAVEETMERVGRFATGMVNGTKISVSVRHVRTQGIWFFESRWEIFVTTPGLYDGPTNGRKFQNKTEAIREFEALVTKYNLTEER